MPVFLVIQLRYADTSVYTPGYLGFAQPYPQDTTPTWHPATTRGPPESPCNACFYVLTYVTDRLPIAGATAADSASLNNLRITKWKCRPCGTGKQLQEKLKFFLCLISTILEVCLVVTFY